MNARRSTVPVYCLLLALLLPWPAACRGEVEVATGAPPREAGNETGAGGRYVLDYQGPALTAALEPGEAGPQGLRVQVEVPSGGWQLELLETKPQQGKTVVILVLTEPGVDEATTDAFETKVSKLALPTERGPVLIYVRTIQRGVEYLVEPEARLAKVLERD